LISQTSTSKNCSPSSVIPRFISLKLEPFRRRTFNLSATNRITSLLIKPISQPVTNKMREGLLKTFKRALRMKLR
jgi:hypothetical protein